MSDWYANPKSFQINKHLNNAIENNTQASLKLAFFDANLNMGAMPYSSFINHATIISLPSMRHAFALVQ